ncbi:MAG: RNA methyltransferase [Pseudomonadota bacterium]
MRTPEIQPIVTLIAPQMGENIGAAARAMLNFGLTAMRLSAPRDGWPNPKAVAMAAGAGRVLDAARVFETAGEALADVQYAVATTARNRELNLPVLSPAETAAELKARASRGERCAILFGGERAGLATGDVARCDAIMTIPVNPDFSSLNLAQAVLVFAYEWGRASDLQPVFEGRLADRWPTEKEDLERLFGHLEGELDRAGYFHPPEKREVMARTLRALLTRADLTAQETQTLRGVVKALAKGRGAGRISRGGS